MEQHEGGSSGLSEARVVLFESPNDLEGPILTLFG